MRSIVRNARAFSFQGNPEHMANTNQPLSEVAIANFAATTLDEQALLTLDDRTTLGKLISREFGFMRDELLRSHPWVFAKKRAALPVLEEAPAFGYLYQYQLPTDCLRLLPVTHNGEEDGRKVRHRVEGRKVLTDLCAPLKIIYIQKKTSASEFDPLFARALGQMFAVAGAHKVTGKTSYLQKAQDLLNQALANAFLVNGLEAGTNDDQLANEIIDVRGACY